MGHAATLSVLGGLALAGAVAGVGLGRSAVADINPLYYGDAEDSFHSDLVANPPLRIGGDTAALRAEPAIVSCIGCRDYPEEYRPGRDAAIVALDTGWPSAKEIAAPALVEETLAAEERADPEREAVVRYASYPVETAVEETLATE